MAQRKEEHTVYHPLQDWLGSSPFRRTTADVGGRGGDEREGQGKWWLNTWRDQGRIIHTGFLFHPVTLTPTMPFPLIPEGHHSPTHSTPAILFPPLPPNSPVQGTQSAHSAPTACLRGQHAQTHLPNTSSLGRKQAKI